MRVVVPCFGRLRSLSFAAGAALAFSLACGGAGNSGLFNSEGGGAATPTGGVIGQGGSFASGGSGPGLSTGGTVLASGGQSSGGAKPSGGATSGGSAFGGSTSKAGSVSTGGTPAGGVASGGTASSGGPTAGGASGGSDSTSGGKNSGGAPTMGGAASGGDSGGISSMGGTAAGGSGGASGGAGGCSNKQMERCDGIDNDCNSKVDELKACPDSCTGFVLGSHSYMVCDVELNANKASALCEEQGMRLAWIESAEENAGLLKFIAGLDTSGRGGGIAEVSIGASDAAKEGQWHWVEGGPAFWEGGAKGSAVNGAYVNWAEGRPNNSSGTSLAGEDCAGLVIDKPDDGDPGEWNDVACADTYGVLCEVP